MASIKESLSGSIKNAITGGVVADKASPEKSTPYLKISAKNFLSISGLARDLNVAKRNIEQLVSLMGGKPVSGNKTDAHFLKEDEREKKLEVERAKSEEKKPEPVKPKKEGKSVLASLKEKFSANKMLKSIGKYLVISAIVTTIFLAFKDTFVEWASGLWKTIKETLDGFVEDIKKWFNESVQMITDKMKEYIGIMIESVSGMFKKIGDFFVESFSKIKEFFEPVMEFVFSVWNKFTGMIDEFKNFLKSKVESAMKIPGVKSLVPNFLISWLGLKEVKEEKIDDTAEKKKLDRQQKEALDTERVRKQEQKSQYKGTDEIVRQRHGIEDKTATMKAEEAKAAPAAPAAAPATAPAAPAAKAEPAKPSDTKPKKLSSETGKKAMISAMNDAKITDPTARAAIMAQVGHESGNFTTLSENLNYKGTSLIKLFPKKFSSPEDANTVAAGGPEKVAERIYGGRMGNAPEGGGDGFKYRGRGFIQLTGKQNYNKFGYGSDPDSVADPKNAADSAIKYMLGYKGDWSDIVKVTKFVNGGTIGLDDRKKHFQEYLNDPQITKVDAVTSAPSGGGVASASTALASDQRQQQKPTTPVIVNAPTTNTTVVKNTQVAASTQKNTAQTVMARAT